MLNSPTAQDSILETDDKGNALPDAKLAQEWYLFFQTLIAGDVGTVFTPTATNLGSTGTPTLTGMYYVNQSFTDFWIKIVPGTNTSSVAGSTYFDIPFVVTVDGFCGVGGTPGAIGLVDSNTKRIYTPAWTNSTATLTVSGRVVSQ